MRRHPGLGGGKSMDVAKGMTIGLNNCPLALVPTIAASDAPVSHVAIIYNEAHERLRVDAMPYSPWVVLVDTEIILNAPAHFLASGIADAVATKFEAEACQAAGAKNYFASAPPRAAKVLGDACWEILREKGPLAYQAVKNKKYHPALEDVVEANTLLSGIGFESGGCAAAHGTMSALTALPASAKYSHGQLVAVGIIVQMCMENRPQEFILEMARFLKSLDLPTTLYGVGLDVDKDQEDFELVVRKGSTPPGLMFNMPMEINAAMFRKALLKANEMGGQ